MFYEIVLENNSKEANGNHKVKGIKLTFDNKEKEELENGNKISEVIQFAKGLIEIEVNFKILSMLDKNRNAIKVGDKVEVSSPMNEDKWKNTFIGTVSALQMPEFLIIDEDVALRHCIQAKKCTKI